VKIVQGQVMAGIFGFENAGVVYDVLENGIHLLYILF
jgi:hypothetical protein